MSPQKSPVASVKAALRQAVAAQQAEIDEEKKREQEADARDREYSKPENVRARLLAHIRQKTRELPEVLKDACAHIQAAEAAVEKKHPHNLSSKQWALNKITQYTFGTRGAHAFYANHFEFVQESPPMNSSHTYRQTPESKQGDEYPVHYLIFNRGEYVLTHETFGKERDDWVKFDVEAVMNKPEARNINVALRAFIKKCQALDIGVDVVPLPARRIDTTGPDYSGDGGGSPPEKTYKDLNAGICLRIFPMADFTQHTVPQILLNPAPRVKKTPASAKTDAAPTPAAS